MVLASRGSMSSNGDRLPRIPMGLGVAVAMDWPSFGSRAWGGMAGGAWGVVLLPPGEAGGSRASTFAGGLVSLFVLPGWPCWLSKGAEGGGGMGDFSMGVMI